MYFIIFGIGAGLILLSLLLGGIFDFGDFELDGFSFSVFLKPTIISVFMVVMGGIGLIAAPRIENGLLVFAISAGGALVVSTLINMLVLIPMRKAQNTSSFHQCDTIGLTAEVSLPIPQNGFGKIRYNVSGSTVTSPAVSEDGNSIPLGEKVKIVRIEKGGYICHRL